ncbi:glycosyltransferase family 4 protein [Methylosinus sp. Ce-a6]|uniref:glycosyltransferase family 4 protein n=1 Tax=Methylosinus sp. Ce-a6 TaxID=2172005 RepID=UPI00135CA42F|nr:glycosyltransferase family 4 protein [Methylosinus sp. Ce-a6]
MDKAVPRLHVAFVIKAMSIPGGGAERVLARIASGLVDRGHRVTVITSDPPEKPSYYPIPGSVRQVFLGVGAVERSSNFGEVLRRIWAMRREIMRRRPDVVVAFMHSSFVPIGLALIGSGIPMIASEHIGTEHYSGRSFQRALLMLTPLLTNKITVVSERIRSRFPRWLRRRMIVVPNPIGDGYVVGSDTADPAAKAKVLLAVGRLSSQKDHRCLIEAFAMLAQRFPDWTLRIVGEGELRGELERQIADCGLADRIELPGAIKEIDAEYRKARLFVSPSKYESFGLATAEALLNGTPAVAFDDCPGTDTLIENGVNGVLVDGRNGRAEALAIALARLMATPEEVERLTQVGAARIREVYGLSKALDTWESVLGDIAVSR